MLYPRTPGCGLPSRAPTAPGPSRSPRAEFDLSDGKPAEFIFHTLDGHIEAWNQDDRLTGNAEDEVTIPGAGYTGLAIATTKHGDELFAADFRTGAVDVFDSEFRQVKPAAWQFRDPGDRARQLGAGARLAPDRELR